MFALISLVLHLQFPVPRAAWCSPTSPCDSWPSASRPRSSPMDTSCSMRWSTSLLTEIPVSCLKFCFKLLLFGTESFCSACVCITVFLSACLPASQVICACGLFVSSSLCVPPVYCFLCVCAYFVCSVKLYHCVTYFCVNTLYLCQLMQLISVCENIIPVLTQ